MAQQFREQSVTKYYLAVVKGVPRQTQGVIDWPIGKVVGAKVPRYGVSQSQQAVEHAKEAVTEYEVIRSFPGHALLQLTPKSGRTHQIRVHLAAIGHPILGDTLYTLTHDDFLAWCEGKKELAEIHLIARQALHCQQNRFVHPITGAGCIIEAPLPADFLNLLEKLAD
jgi:23S rRNA pseudouridine1911/1915/1917 synthase